MKLSIQPNTGRRRKGRCAFTLPEYMTAMAVTILASAGILALVLFCGRMLATAQTQLVSATESRALTQRLVHDIRVAAWVEVGTGDETSFQRAPRGSRQQGNAIQVYLSMNTNQFVRYFVDPQDRTLKRVRHDRSETLLLASWVADPNVFSLEDSRGTVSTDWDYLNTVGIRVECERGVFHQPQPSSTRQTPQWTYPHRFETRVTPRTTLGFQAGTAVGT